MQLSEKALAISPSLTLKITAMAKEMKARGLDVVGFGAGEPDFDTPQHIKDAAVEAVSYTHLDVYKRQGYTGWFTTFRRSFRRSSWATCLWLCLVTKARSTCCSRALAL